MQITVTQEEMRVLRAMFARLEETGIPVPKKKEKRETKAEKKNRFLNLIESGARATKPKHLKK